MTSRRMRWISLICLGWAALLVLNLVPILRGDFGWRWPYQLPQDWTRLLPLVLGLAVYVAGAWWLRRRQTAALILWTVLGGVGLALAGFFVRDEPLFALYSGTVDPGTTGWHYVAAHINDLTVTLREWTTVMRRAEAYSAHVHLSPPGWVLLYYALNRLLDHAPLVAQVLGQPLRAAQCQNYHLIGYSNAQFASAWAGMLMPLWGALTVIPLYALARRVFGASAARWSIIWWPIVPAMLMFSPTPNTFYPFVAVLIVALLASGLEHDSIWPFLAAGGLLSLVTFLNLSVLPLIGLLGLFLVGASLARSQLPLQAIRRLNWRWLVKMGFVMGIGAASIWLIFNLISGVSFLDILQAMANGHLALDRPYAPWLVLHLNDFFMFTGWPLVLVAIFGVWYALRRIRQRAPLSAAEAFIGATAITVLLVDVSGIMRGETGRVLLFLSPFVVAIAAYTLTNVMDNLTSRDGWLLTATQCVMVVAIMAAIPNQPALTRPPTTPTASVPPTAPQPVRAMFGGVLQLDAFAGQVELPPTADGQPQPTLNLWLDWNSTGQVDVPYYLSFIPVAPDGRAAPQADLQQPFGQEYPTTCWQPSSGPIRQQAAVPLFNSQPGEWWVSLALVDGNTGRKLAVTLPDGSSSDQVGLGPFRLP